MSQPLFRPSPIPTRHAPKSLVRFSENTKENSLNIWRFQPTPYLYTKGNASFEVIANCDNMSINIESLIHTFRGQKVMLDFDLAMLYGVQTKALNQAVKRNIKRFPDDFMFQMTKEELDSLRSQIATANPAGHHNIEEWRSQFVTSNFTRMGLRRPPYAFTRNGIGMLRSCGSHNSLPLL